MDNQWKFTPRFENKLYLKELAEKDNEIYILQENLNIAIKALNDIYALRSNNYFGLQFEVFEIVLNAFKKIEEIKRKF